MYYDDERSTLSFVAGLALGALIGAGAALLMAPQSGSKTRKQLTRTAEDWSETATDTLESAGERLQDAAEDVRKVADDAKRAAEHAGSKIKTGVKRTRTHLSR